MSNLRDLIKESLQLVMIEKGITKKQLKEASDFETAKTEYVPAETVPAAKSKDEIELSKAHSTGKIKGTTPVVNKANQILQILEKQGKSIQYDDRSKIISYLQNMDQGDMLVRTAQDLAIELEQKKIIKAI
jgi:hypothetical protein